MKAIETITIRTVAKGSNLSRKAILKAIEELGVEVFCMRMKAYGIYKGYVNQIKLSDAEKVIAKAVNYKEEPKQPRVPKVEQLKANGFEILSETKTQYRLSKDGVIRSVGKSKSIAKILEKFETKQEEKKEEKKEEVKPVEEKKEEATPISFEDVYGGEIDPITGIEGVEVEDEFGEKLEEAEEDTSLDLNKLCEMYAKKDAAAAKKEARPDVDEEIEPQIIEEAKKEPATVKQYSEFVPAIKKAIEKERPGTEVKNVIVMDKVDDTHFWVNWNGIDHNSDIGNMETFMPLEEVVIE